MTEEIYDALLTCINAAANSEWKVDYEASVKAKAWLETQEWDR